MQSIQGKIDTAIIYCMLYGTQSVCLCLCIYYALKIRENFNEFFYVFIRLAVLRVNSIPENLSEKGAKGDWDFRISDLVKNPDGTDI